MSLINSLKFSETDNLDLHSQLEELKGLLRANNLLLKDNEQKHVKTVENYEAQINRMNEESKQLREKYDKVLEAQRKLEKLNSNLEEKLLNIVEKYEKEQKSLLEELTLAHAKLVEVKLSIEEIEKEKEAYKEDCNLAVNLLQCKPSEFVSHSYNTLPVNLKERLRQTLTSEELMKLDGIEENEYEKSRQTQQQSFKIPVIQPTAAAAMMYGYTALQREKSKIAQQQHQLQQQQLQQNLRITDDGRVASSLLAELLRKDTTSSGKSKMAFKLFPYMCLRCKKEIVLCDSPTQTGDDADYVRVVDARARSILSPAESSSYSSSSKALFKSKTIGTKLSDTIDSSSLNSAPKPVNTTTTTTIDETKSSLNRLQII